MYYVYVVHYEEVIIIMFIEIAFSPSGACVLNSQGVGVWPHAAPHPA